MDNEVNAAADLRIKFYCIISLWIVIPSKVNTYSKQEEMIFESCT